MFDFFCLKKCKQAKKIHHYKNKIIHSSPHSESKNNNLTVNLTNSDYYKKNYASRDNLF